MSDFITPTVGRVVWFYPPSNSIETGFSGPAEGEPLAAIIARAWNDSMVNLTVFDASGRPHPRTSVPLVQEDKIAPRGNYCTWMPFQKGQARAQAAVAEANSQKAANEPVVVSQASAVLYPAIRNAMEELGALHPGFNDHVNRAWNHLHRAFWSEVPAPASAPGLRDTLLCAEPGIELGGAASSGPGPLRVVTKAEEHGAVERLFEAKGRSGRIAPSIVRETIAYRRHMAFEQVEAHRVQVAKIENNLATWRCDHRDAVQLLAELDEWIADNPAPTRAA
jgi:hypothetical protein